MHASKMFFVTTFCIMFMGCVSQQAHERAIEALEISSQHSAQEVERLQQLVEDKQETVTRLEKEKQGVEKTVDSQETVVAQLQEAKTNLEQTIVVQEQANEQRLEAIKEKLEALYSQVAGMGLLSSSEAQPGTGSRTMNGLFSPDSVDLGDLTQAFQKMRSLLQTQIKDFAQLRTQNGQLEHELKGLEGRLQELERLQKELENMRADREAEEDRYARVKSELEQVRVAREEQEARFAKVKQEVQTVGEEIDRITKALEEQFGKSLLVTQHQDRLVLTMLGQVLFESGEAELTPLGLEIMKQVGHVLASLPNKNIQVEGHTDNNPIYGQLQNKFPTNWELSTARATTVLRFLIEETGMAPTYFSASGYADIRPVTSNDTEDGRAQNRRVEIVLFPQQVGQEDNTVATLSR